MDEAKNGTEPKRRRFFRTVSLGNILAGVVILGSCIGVYTAVLADVREHKTEIANLKQSAVEQKANEAQSRREIKDEIREVKDDVREVRDNIQKILFELQRRNDKSR